MLLLQFNEESEENQEEKEEVENMKFRKMRATQRIAGGVPQLSRDERLARRGAEKRSEEVVNSYFESSRKNGIFATSFGEALAGAGVSRHQAKTC